MRALKQINPFGLSAVECDTLDALIAHGNDKAAARTLCIEPQTVKSRTARAREKMQVIHGSPVSRLQAAVLWDRYVQSLEQAAGVEA
jgi:FixJ family two-component response regulator